jgi:predicted RNA-binding Zn ribbon-like protein
MTRLDLNEPEQLLVPIAQSASDLIRHGNLPRVKRCANPAYGIFFTTPPRTIRGARVVRPTGAIA